MSFLGLLILLNFLGTVSFSIFHLGEIVLEHKDISTYISVHAQDFIY